MRRPTPSGKDLQGFCPYLHELPAAFTTFWHQLHGAALLVEHPGRKLKFTPAPVTVTKAACSTGGNISGGHRQRALPAAGLVSSSGLGNSRPSFPVARLGKCGFGTALLFVADFLVASESHRPGKRRTAAQL